MTDYLVQFPKLGWEFNISREAFRIGDFVIYWYGIIIALAFFVALMYGLRRAKTFGLDPDKVIDVALGGIIGGIIGARLYYVLFSLDEMTSWKDIFLIREGGLAIYGGIIGSIGVGWLMCKWRKVKFLPLTDLTGTGFLIGQAIGRWGNFFNQEAFGSNTSLPWGMFSENTEAYLRDVNYDLYQLGIDIDPTAPVHPCFLYESLWCILGFVLLFAYTKRRKFDGEIFLMYTAWYGAGRFVIEGLRTDSLMIMRVRVSQLLAGLLFAVAVITILIVRSKIRRNNDPEYLKLYVNTEESQAQFIKDKQESDAEADGENNGEDEADQADQDQDQTDDDVTDEETELNDEPMRQDGSDDADKMVSDMDDAITQEVAESQEVADVSEESSEDSLQDLIENQEQQIETEGHSLPESEYTQQDQDTDKKETETGNGTAD